MLISQFSVETHSITGGRGCEFRGDVDSPHMEDTHYLALSLEARMGITQLSVETYKMQRDCGCYCYSEVEVRSPHVKDAHYATLP